MVNRIAVVLICFILMFSMVACDDQGKNVGYGSLLVEIANSDNSKTIQPTDESLNFTTYSIRGKHGTTGEWVTYGPFFSKKIRVNQLEIGDWEFVVEGYNKESVLLAKSEPHSVTIKADGPEKETYTLHWIEGGYGSLRLSLKVQTSKVSTIECRMFEVDKEIGTFRMTKEDSILGNDEFYLFEHCFENVPAGVYEAEITMKDDRGKQIGKTLHQSVHIHDGLESSFDFSWRGLPELLPMVDVPKPCFNDGSSLPCDSKILLDTDEENTNIFYSFDGELYLNYSEYGIDLTKVKGISTSLTIWAYAEKRYMDKSDVVVFTYVIQHPDEMVHIEAKDSSCSEVGWSAYDRCSKCLYYQNYNEIPTIEHDLIHHNAKAETCSDIGWYAYDTCSRCEYTTYVEIPAQHVFVDFECKRCGTWMKGPAGGCVFYDKGFYSEGWRYLEIAPTELHVVNGVPTVDSTIDGYYGTMYEFVFGYYRESKGGSNIHLSTKTGIGEGYNNTKLLVDRMKRSAYTDSTGDRTTSNYAARLCMELRYKNEDGTVFDDWFLPSRDELNLMYKNLYKNKVDSFCNGSDYWSSSEDSADVAWTQDFSSDYLSSYSRNYALRVRPIRAF